MLPKHASISIRIVAFWACVAVLFGGMSSAYAGVGAWNQNKYASLVVDGQTGAVIRQQNAGKLRYPASLTKLMTLYVTFLALQKGKLNMNERFVVSAHAASRPPSKLFLRAGSTVAVRDLVNALAIKSANDAASVLAEGISGSEPEFARLMTKVASRLGMRQTQFRNASGLHDPAQYTTAYDMARLAIAMKRDFPQYYYVFKKDSFVYNGQTHYSHNNVTRNYAWVDGLKTGFVNASGFNLVTSAYKNNRRLIGVVMGGNTAGERDSFMVSMLNDAFNGSNVAANNNNRLRVNNGASAVAMASAVSGAASLPAPALKLKPDLSSFAVAAASNDVDPDVTMQLKPSVPSRRPAVAAAAPRYMPAPIQVASVAPPRSPAQVAPQYRPAVVTVLQYGYDSPKSAAQQPRYSAPRVSPFVTPSGPEEVAAYYAGHAR
ncbi:MAG: D-alanyl-D-alanine carboxypeptidase family protein [Rickettsiales bacterium]